MKDTPADTQWRWRTPVGEGEVGRAKVHFLPESSLLWLPWPQMMASVPRSEPGFLQELIGLGLGYDEATPYLRSISSVTVL